MKGSGVEERDLPAVVLRSIRGQGTVGGDDNGVWECGCWQSAEDEYELCVRHLWMAKGAREALEDCSG